MLDSLIFAGLDFRGGGLFAHDPGDCPVLCRRNPDMRGEKVGEMALRGKSQLVADVGDRRLRTHQAIERALHPHRICIERRRQARVFPKKLEEMRTRKAGVARHATEFDTLGEAIVKQPERFTDTEIDGLRGRAATPGRRPDAQDVSKLASKSWLNTRWTIRKLAAVTSEWQGSTRSIGSSLRI